MPTSGRGSSSSYSRRWDTLPLGLSRHGPPAAMSGGNAPANEIRSHASYAPPAPRPRVAEPGDAEDPAAVRDEPAAASAVPAWKTSAPAASASATPWIGDPGIAPSG